MASSPENSSPPPNSPPPSSPPPSNQSPPPSPPNSSSPPPPNNSSPPPPKNSSPPPNNPSSPPSSPPPKDNNSPPSPNSNNDNNNNNGNNNNNASPPPPPPPFSAPPGHKSPPSPQLSPPSNGKSSGPSSGSSLESNSPSGNNGNISVPLRTIIGVAIGAGALLVLMIVIAVLCSRKKKKRKQFDDQIPYYTDHARSPAVGAGFYQGAGTPSMGAQNMWQDSLHKQHAINILHPPPGLIGGATPPRGAWQVPPSPQVETPPSLPMNHSTDVSSSNYSGPYGPPLPPPPPSVALGFNQSSFSYGDLTIATQGFAHANLLGQGGFGYVHKGVLPNGKEIAVKSLKVGSGQGDREFQAEVEIISRVHHRHLVALVGFCMAGDRRILVYEFIPNKTLEFHLHGKGHSPMNWATRVRIALGGAKGLAYLHEDCHPRIIHRDIKSANILLDYSFEAKVADFGLAKLTQENNTHVSTRVMGTFGYLAPEYASSGKLTEKSDVFSYGVVLLELITGRHPVNESNADVDDSLVDWARTMCPQATAQQNYDQLVDPSLENKYNRDEMVRMVQCATAAIRHSAKRRPKMRQIVRALEEDIPLDDLNEDARTEQSSSFSAKSASVEEESANYSADLRKLRKMASAHREVYESSEFGHTSEYGLDPSPSSSDADSDEHTNKDKENEKEKVHSP